MPAQDEDSPVDGDPPRAMLTGGPGGPSGWAVTTDAGPPEAVTLDELRHIERQLRGEGQRDAALGLGQQIDSLEDIADEWRRVDAQEPPGDPAASDRRMSRREPGMPAGGGRRPPVWRRWWRWGRRG
jgi:hypothetical protein